MIKRHTQTQGMKMQITESIEAAAAWSIDLVLRERRRGTFDGQHGAALLTGSTARRF